jgi:CBS domain containing-hemolysin-like protein
VTAVLLLGMLVLILVNAFFVAAEFSLVRARRTRWNRSPTEMPVPSSPCAKSARSASISPPVRSG